MNTTIKRRPGRPLDPNKKRLVTLRLEQQTVSAFEATGPGWRTRIDAVLAEHVRQQRETGINPPPP